MLTRAEILNRLGEISDTELRQSIHKHLTEHEQMRRRLEHQADYDYWRYHTKEEPFVDERSVVRHKGPHGAILSD